jgi:hypothetical protein
VSTIEMRSRVMSQLATLPEGQDRTSAELAAQMVGVAAADIESTLEQFRREGLATRVDHPRGKPGWRRT